MASQTLQGLIWVLLFVPPQALGLHKESSEARWSSTYYEDMGLQERCQLKWRLSWAIHTVDRFSAMCYGLPPLVSDDSCVAGIPREDTTYPLFSSSSFLMVEGDLQQVTDITCHYSDLSDMQAQVLRYSRSDHLLPLPAAQYGTGQCCVWDCSSNLSN